MRNTYRIFYSLGLLFLLVLAVPNASPAQPVDALIPGSYIAVYSGNAAAAARAAQRAGGTVVFNHARAGVLFVQSARPDFAARLTGTSGVSSVIPDRWIGPRVPVPTAFDAVTPGLSAGEITNLASPFGALLLPLQWNIFQTQTDIAWAVTLGDPSVKVAIVDTGICAHHVDLAGKVNAQLSRSFVPATDEVPETAEPSCIGCPVWEDRHGHGTWVASVVSTNNWGMAGVAPNVQLVAVKVANHQDRGSLTTLTRGILYAADAGVDVINVSRDYGVNPIPEFPRGMAFLLRMFAYATSQGALLVFGAGNDGVDLDHAGNAIAVPCETTNGMCIGASTVSDALASFSNHGVSAVTMVAPGGGVAYGSVPGCNPQHKRHRCLRRPRRRGSMRNGYLPARQGYELRGAHGVGCGRTRLIEKSRPERQTAPGQGSAGQLR
jgi:subtilisin family serine protease